MIRKFGFIAASTLSVLVMVAPFLAQADTLTRYLSVGMSGSDVTAVQSFLAQDETLYPQGLVTGYFGSLTRAAVINFQIRNDIIGSATDLGAGRIGPATLPVMNMQMANGASNTSMAPVITNVAVAPSRATANVSWNTNVNARGVVYYSTNPLSIGENSNSASVSGATAMTDNLARVSQNVALSNLLPNTTYYYLVYTTDQTGNVSMTWPSSFQTTN